MNSESRLTTSPLTLARIVASSVGALDGVVGLSPGRTGEVATHGPGGEVGGVRLVQTTTGLAVEVHVVAQLCPLPELARLVRQTVLAQLTAQGQRVSRVNVVIADLKTESDSQQT